jgi:hypothetical protein
LAFASCITSRVFPDARCIPAGAGKYPLWNPRDSPGKSNRRGPGRHPGEVTSCLLRVQLGWLHKVEGGRRGEKE